MQKSGEPRVGNKPMAKQGGEIVRMPGDVSIKRIVISAFIGVAVSMVVALVLAGLMGANRLGAEHQWLWAGIALAVGGLVAGLLSGGRRKALLCGILAALGMLAFLVLIGLLAFGGSFSMKLCLLNLIILLVSCIIGSVIASFVK